MFQQGDQLVHRIHGARTVVPAPDRQIWRAATACLASELALARGIPFEQLRYQVEGSLMS